ncbi:hypothetical protein TNCV_54811 [Trichonephila clavipes]|nr:hypothetical protein TNCV_54811 [Trichonephila clavipes]
MGRLVFGASDSRPEGLGLMPPNTLRVNTEYALVKLVGPKVLWSVAAKATELSRPLGRASHSLRIADLEVAWPLRMPKVVGSIPAGVNRFSRCEDHRNACYMIMWNVKYLLNNNLA